MGYPIEVALRYMGSKKRAFISVSTAFAIAGVTLGVAALATVMSVTGGFQAQFREKVLGVNAHVLVLKYSTDFREYRTIMNQVAKVPGVVGAAPFSINPMMLTHGDATATGVLLKGVDPATSLGVDAPPGTIPVLDLPKQMIDPKSINDPSGNHPRLAAEEAARQFRGLRLPGSQPAERRIPPGKRAYDEPDPVDAGAPSNAGSPEPTFLEQLKDDVERRSTAKDSAPAPSSTNSKEAVIRGAIEPAGGYKSPLPSDDDLPPDVDPDLCADATKVMGMPGIIVGITLAKTLQLKPDDCVTVTSPTIGYSFSGGSLKPPVARRFRVVGFFEAGFDQYDSKLVYTDLYQAQAFYDQGDTVTGVEMKVKDIDTAPAISARIADMLSNGIYHTMDWEELNHGLFTALLIQRIVMSAVLALIILVAAFTVVATLIMVVLDKKKEISVFKAMGASDDAILRIFLYQGGIIGGIGTSLGLGLGLLVCKGLLVYGFPLDPKVYFISRLPVIVRWQEFVLTGVIAIGICLIATVVPSMYAARLRPADGFREQ